LVLARTAYPYSSAKKAKTEPLSWHTTYFSENYNEGGLHSVFGFSSMTEGRI